MRTRQATIEDVGSLADLFDRYRQFYQQPSDLAGARLFISERLTKSESIIFLAESDSGQIMGFAQLYPSFSSVSMKRLWILNDLFVSFESRGTGVGKDLLAACSMWARQTEAKGLTLKTAVDNTAAQRLYQAQGWKRDDRYVSYNLTLI
ncbi:MAG: N-acetyltransferase family protein [Pseudobdellovibrionaceae bacterium]